MISTYHLALYFAVIIPSIIFCLFLVLFLRQVFFYVRAKDRRRAERLLAQLTEELVKEKEKMENILSRMLPAQTAKELQLKGQVTTERYNMVTVLFADIEGFTLITDSINAERLIDSLDRFFYDLDDIVMKYGVEKIKTIGDAYMCAGGLPERNRTNPVEVVLAGLEMQRHMESLNSQLRSADEAWGLRIGINTGQVISGVVGRDKISYDIWGSAVNVASRMESSGEVGKINISGNTYFFVREFFVCRYRGAMPVKNRGNIDMYFVEGIHPELSVNGAGIIPNEEFMFRLQYVRISDLEDYVLSLLEQKLPDNLYYHNLKHTVDVYTQVELIGREEGVSERELLLLRTAALLHDAGHIIDYQTHEEMGVKLAYEILPKYQYTEGQITEVAKLIMATKMPVAPKSLLEQIICDADSDYLGRRDFTPVASKLYDELKERGLIGTELDWVNLQIEYVTNHQYFTATARKLRETNKQDQLDQLYSWKTKILQAKA